MDACNERVAVAEGKIKFVEDQIADVESGLLKPNANTSYLREERKQLREEKILILEEKRLILEEKRLILELILRQSPGE
jgi:hypothetical protein